MADDFFRQCSTCKKPIGWATRYYVCSVSTCQQRSTNFVFCAMDCWDAHVPTFRHKEAWAEERMSPRAGEGSGAGSGGTDGANANANANEAKPARIVMPSAPAASSVAAAAPSGSVASDDILIVASKLKAYIRARSGMNTSEGVMRALSDEVRKLADAAIERAKTDGRKTVMDRDF